MKSRRVKESKRHARKSKPSSGRISKAEYDESGKEPWPQQNKQVSKVDLLASAQHHQLQGDKPFTLQKQGAKQKQSVPGEMTVSNVMLKKDGGFDMKVQESQMCSPHGQSVKTTKDSMDKEVFLQAVDGKSGQGRGRKRARKSREEKLSLTRGRKMRRLTEKTCDLPGKIPLPSTPEAKRDGFQSTPQNLPSTRNINDSSVISGAKSDTEGTSLDQSFQLDVLNLGYRNSPNFPGSSGVKVCSTKKPNISMADSDKKMLRITAPVYFCPSNQPETGSYDKRKRKPVKRRCAKRRLCEEIKSSSGQSLLEINRPAMMNLGLTRSLRKSSGPEKRDLSNSDTRIWFSSSLQIDTMGCDSHNGIKKDYNRVDLICVTCSSFRPQCALSSYPDAVNARVTYDKDGKVVVLEVMGSITPGIYRVIHTRVAIPHESLTRAVAMETLLVRCSAIKNLKPHSQYLVLGNLHRIPRHQWREKISATVVRLHMEDFLHTYNFHTFALPLLLWNGEKVNWSWAKEPAKKFHATRRPEGASGKFTGNNKSKNAPLLTASVDTILHAAKTTVFMKTIPKQSNV